MDKKDNKLLAELIINSRLPVNRLAKKVGISREVANYRINRIVKEKVILDFYTIIDTEKLGFLRYTCFLQLKGISRDKEKIIIDKLVKNSFITYMGLLIGKWNLVLDILAKSRTHLENVVNEIKGNVSPYLDNYLIINTGTEQEIFPTKLFGVNKKLSFNKKSKSIKIDKIDLKLLKALSKNSRAEYKDLSTRIGLSANAIKHRINNLENSGIIQGYTISIDKRKLGYEWYNIQIKLNEDNAQLKEFLRQHKKVIYFYKYIGHENWDLDAGIIVKDSLDLRDFILDLREKFGNIIKIYDIYVIIEESKGNYAPEGIFEELP